MGNGWSGIPNAIGVTSCHSGEGVSTVSANLAIAAANVFEERVLLVDANVHRASVGRVFKIASEEGLLNVLAREQAAFDSVSESPIVNLAVMSIGKLRQGREPAYDAKSIDELIDGLKHVFPLMVFDLPPANELTTCFSFASRLDGVLLVIEAERVEEQVARRACQQLANIGTNLLGVVLNRHDKS
jgi:capsular exopolysaccharide synthesis family protein